MCIRDRLVVLIGYIFVRGLPHITGQLLSTAPSVLKDTIGILPNILNTLYIILFTLLIALDVYKRQAAGPSFFPSGIRGPIQAFFPKIVCVFDPLFTILSQKAFDFLCIRTPDQPGKPEKEHIITVVGQTFRL